MQYITFVYISGASSFTPEDAFVGYQSDTPASIVFKVWQDFNFNDVELSDDDDKWEEKVHSCVFIYITIIICSNYNGYTRSVFDL